MTNFINNHDFRMAENDTPLNWGICAPREVTKPAFHWKEGELGVSGTGNVYNFGYWQQEIPVKPGWYRFTTRFTTSDIDDIPLQVLNMILWKRPGHAPRQCPQDIITGFARSGGQIEASEVFQAPPDVVSAEIQLGCRFVSRGNIVWHSAKLEPCDPVAPRQARVTAVRWGEGNLRTPEECFGDLARLLDQSGAVGSDLVLLPEMCNRVGEVRAVRSAEEIAEPIPGGPTVKLLQEKAKQHHMYVVAGLIEADGDTLFNTAVLIGRNGELEGRYRKVHPYWPEEMFDGIMPGDSLPVFDLDFGRIGVMVCYDSWFPESARLLGLQGAEMILFPAAGYEPLILPARAIDNRAYVVASALGGKAMILNTVGHTLAETDEGLITASIDLSYRPTPHTNAGGGLNASPGGRRVMRHALSGRIYEDIQKEVCKLPLPADQFRWFK